MRTNINLGRASTSRPASNLRFSSDDILPQAWSRGCITLSVWSGDAAPHTLHFRSALFLVFRSRLRLWSICVRKAGPELAGL